MNAVQEEAVPLFKEYEQEGFLAWTKQVTKSKLINEEGKHTEESVHALDDFEAWVRQYANLEDATTLEKTSFQNEQAYFDALANAVIKVLTNANQKKAIKAFKAQQVESARTLEEIVSGCADVTANNLTEQTTLLAGVTHTFGNKASYAEAQAALTTLRAAIEAAADATAEAAAAGAGERTADQAQALQILNEQLSKFRGEVTDEAEAEAIIDDDSIDETALHPQDAHLLEMANSMKDYYIMKRDKFLRENELALAAEADKNGQQDVQKEDVNSTPLKATAKLDMELLASLLAGEMVPGASKNASGSSKITELQKHRAYNDFAHQERDKQRRVTGTGYVPSQLTLEALESEVWRYTDNAFYQTDNEVMRKQYSKAVLSLYKAIQASDHLHKGFNINPSIFNIRDLQSESSTSPMTFDLEAEVASPLNTRETQSALHMATWVATCIFANEYTSAKLYAQAYDRIASHVEAWLNNHRYLTLYKIPGHLHNTFARAVMNGMAELWDSEKRGGSATAWGHIDPVGASVAHMCAKMLTVFAKMGACESGKNKLLTAAEPHDEPPQDKDNKRKGGPSQQLTAPKIKKPKDEKTTPMKGREWESKSKMAQLSWAMRYVPAFKDKIDDKQCMGAQLPQDYTNFICTGQGHDPPPGRTKLAKPSHGMCLLKACTARTTHKTSDSPDCMKVIEDAREAGRKAFLHSSPN